MIYAKQESVCTTEDCMFVSSNSHIYKLKVLSLIMKVDFNSKILNLKGEPVKDGKENEEVILKDICVNSLLFDKPATQGERPQTGKDKLIKYNLAQKIFVGGEVEVTAEEITLMKKAIGELYTTLIVGSAWKLLEE